MKISIVMATYNGSRYIQEQLRSFVDQTRPPDELVIIDDGSTDNTQEIIGKFARTAPFEVHYSRNTQNIGYAKNFSLALTQATGDLIFLSDQDDVWFPDKLEKIEDIATRSKCLVFMNDASLTDSKLKELGVLNFQRQHWSRMGYSSLVTGCCLAVRRELLNIILPVPSEYRGHDGWIVHMAEAMGAMYRHDEVLQYRRRHESNVTQLVIESAGKGERLKVLAAKAMSQWQGGGEASGKMVDSVRHAEIFLQGLTRAYNSCELPQCEKLSNSIRNMQNYSKLVNERKVIRSRSRLSRVPHVFRFWFKGKYKYLNGLQSAFVDLISR